MKRLIIIISLLATFLFSQDRSVIFNTGSPDSTIGHLIDINHSVANRITVANDYVLEAMVFYMTSQNINQGNVKVSIREDNNGAPGELVSELSEWTHQIDLLHPANYNLIVTTDLCIYLDGGNYYWWMIEAVDESTQATWIYSNSPFYNISTTEDAGTTWNSQFNYAGSGGIWAEQIFENATIDGDINFDFLVNISILSKDITGLEEELKILLIPKDPNDSNNTILEIRSGTGGDEAALFASDLMRMYTRYAERSKWSCEFISLHDNEGGGIKEAVISIKGSGAYGEMKFEISSADVFFSCLNAS